MTGRRRHNERPTRRTNPSGKAVWIARYTRPDGRRDIWKPAWNGDKGTFARMADAQVAIDEAHAFWERRPARIDTVGGYAATWTERHPRSERTNDTNDHRVGRALDIGHTIETMLGTYTHALRRSHEQVRNVIG